MYSIAVYSRYIAIAMDRLTVSRIYDPSINVLLSRNSKMIHVKPHARGTPNITVENPTYRTSRSRLTEVRPK